MRARCYDLAKRLEARVERVPFSGCWIWMGWTVPQGYGITLVDGVQTKAHRLSWQIANGSAPGSLFVCHRCDVPECINPEHLFLGTDGDNTRDAASKGRLWQQKVTHCPQGHPYDEPNTYVQPRGWRSCKACNRTAARNLWRRKNRPGEGVSQ